MVPPQPDAPGPRGGLLDFLDGLKSKPEAKPADAKAKAANAKAKATPAPAKAPKIFQQKKKKADKRAEPARALVAAKAPERRKPRPTPVRSKSSRSWRPLLFKLLVGVGVASGAVAMQDRLPRVEDRSEAVTASQKISEPVATPLYEVKAHSGGVVSVRHTNDGKHIVTSGKDGALKVWDAATHALTRTLELDDGPATSIALSGSRVLTGHANGKAMLWDFEKGDRLGVFKRNDAEIWSVTFLGREDRFATASHDWKLAMWDAAADTPAFVVDAHDNSVQAAAYSMSPRGPLIATGSADKSVRLWNVDTQKRVRRYSGHRDFVTALAFSPDAKRIASGGLDGSIRLWSTASSRTQRRLYGHRGRVGGLAFMPAGNALVSAGEDGKVRVWDLKRRRAARVLPGTFAPQRAVSVSPDGQHIAAAGR